CLRVGAIPLSVQLAAGFSARRIYLCPKNLYQHIRNHDVHPTQFDLVQWIPWLIEHGGILQDHPRTIVFYAHIPHVASRYLWLPVKQDGLGEKLWVRGFHLRGGSNAPNKIKRGKVLRFW